MRGLLRAWDNTLLLNKINYGHGLMERPSITRQTPVIPHGAASAVVLMNHGTLKRMASCL